MKIFSSYSVMMFPLHQAFIMVQIKVYSSRVHPASLTSSSENSNSARLSVLNSIFSVRSQGSHHNALRTVWKSGGVSRGGPLARGIREIQINAFHFPFPKIFGLNPLHQCTYNTGSAWRFPLPPVLLFLQGTEQHTGIPLNSCIIIFRMGQSQIR